MHWIKQKTNILNKNHIDIHLLQNKKELIEKFERRKDIAAFIIEYLFDKIKNNPNDYEQNKEELLMEFSVHELKNAYNDNPFYSYEISINDIEDTLFYLSRIDALKIEGGFFVIYNKLTIERIEKDKQDSSHKCNFWLNNNLFITNIGFS